MEIRKILVDITNELKETSQDLEEAQIKQLEESIYKAEKIFVAGAGRSLLMIRGFAMRLMHMGFTAYVVGETVTPAISDKDLLIVASGSGNTSTLVTMANKCKKVGAKLALITANPTSSIGQLADVLVEVKTSTSKGVEGAKKSIQPGGNTFEQMVLLIGDAIIIDITSSRTLEENNAILMGRHANLE